MKKFNEGTIERIKDILLVVLFLTTVLLLYFFWENATNETFKFPDFIGGMESEQILEAASVVLPTDITVSFGNQVYTVINDDNEKLWKKAVNELKKFGEAANFQSGLVLVKELTKESYEKAIAFYPSIQFQFHYDIPFQEFCEFYDFKRQQGYEIIEGISTITYSELSKESILLHQQKDDKYFAIVADKDYTDFGAMIAGIEKSSYVSYYPANTFFGENINNSKLLPLALQSDLMEIDYEKESSQTDDPKVRALAGSFFGESFDFIRQYKDTNGNTTYMYGYGQKIFNINTDGSFEYKEEVPRSTGKQLGFFDSLTLTLQFVENHGGWNSLDGTQISPFLKMVTPIKEEKKSGYRFVFGMKIGSQSIFFQNSVPVVIEVINGKITYYKRDMIDLSENAAENYSSGEPENTFDPVKVLTENYDEIYGKLKESGIPLAPMIDREKAFNQIAGSIISMEIGYVRPTEIPEQEEQEKKLKPCYRITFGKKIADDKDGKKSRTEKVITMYFELFNNAEPIGYELENEMNLKNN